MNADGRVQTKQTNLTNNPGLDGDSNWSPDRSQFVFASQRDSGSEIYVMNAVGFNQTRLTTDGGEYPS